MERREENEARIVAFPAARARPSAELGDLRFRTLLGEAAWAALPEATRARFGKRIADCRAALYAGETVECRMNLAGRILAQAARLIGGPLPLSRDTDLPAMVAVTEDMAGGGQIWTRIYGRRRGFPQVINSCKRFAGPTGLEEHIGRGFGIALRVEVENGALDFIGDHYFFAAWGIRVRIPRWLAPGRLVVSHIDCNHGLFAFVLVLTHGWLGEMIRQTVLFRDSAVEEG